MDSLEIKKELEMDYLQLVEHLKKKYGEVQGDYFVNETCSTPNSKIKRTKEGLIIHHIDEVKTIDLNDKERARNNPFEYQKADRLVYCNILEHLILHIKIVETPNVIQISKKEILGVGGIENYIVPDINAYFNGYPFKNYKKDLMPLIDENFGDYIDVLLYYINAINSNKDLIKLGYANINNLTKCVDGSYFKDLYDALTGNADEIKAKTEMERQIKIARHELQCNEFGTSYCLAYCDCENSDCQMWKGNIF